MKTESKDDDMTSGEKKSQPHGKRHMRAEKGEKGPPGGVKKDKAGFWGQRR